MLTKLENNLVRIEPSDWRWSATIVGLSKYFNYFNNRGEGLEFNIDEDYIEFSEKDISENRYLNFVEGHFRENMHHLVIEELLENDTLTKGQKDLLKEKMGANTIVKKVFKGLKANLEDKKKILEALEKNRSEIIKLTYKGGRALYYNFCNENNLFAGEGKVCRVRGYKLDMGKKGKSASFMRNKNSFVYQDSEYFDFIPFAFSKSRETFFINNNYDLNDLIVSNKNDFSYEDRENTIRSDIFFRTKESSSFIDYSVEVIKKDRENDYFETLYIRDEAIKIFEEIEKIDSKVEDKEGTKEIKEVLKTPCKVGNDFIPIEKIVTDRIIDLVKLDNLIEKLFKEGNKKFLIWNLIRINILIYREVMSVDEKNQEKLIAQIRAVANEIKTKLKGKENKLRGYEQRLISAISLKDYDRVKEILLHLSAYTQVRMDFLVTLFNNFEENKNLAYTFINLIGVKNNSKQEEKK